MAIRQVDNALDLLEYFAQRGRSASMAEVARHFGWPRSSTFNMLSTLAQRGYLYEPEERGRFYPTPRWMDLAQRLMAAAPLPPELLDIARDLATRTGETLFIGGPSGLNVVMLFVIPSPAAVRYAAEVGNRVPLHATASGQAILSQWTEAQRNTALRKVVFERYGSGTPLSIEAVESQMRAGLQRGWFRSASNFSIELGGVSLPVPLAGRIFALTVAGPISRIESSMPAIGLMMQQALAERLGRDFLTTAIKGLTLLDGGDDQPTGRPTRRHG